MNTNEIKVRKIQITNNEHPEWGTWGVMEDKGDWFVILGDRGTRVLFKDEAEKDWSIVETAPKKVLGYKIESTGQKDGGKVAYKLHGPRVTYTLVRMVNEPEFMFVMNSRNNVGSIKGNYTFTDKHGELVPYYLGA